MKLIQLNMWNGGKLGSAIARFVTKEDPDILCLQESVRVHGDSAGFFIGIDQIKDILHAKDLYFSPVFAYQFMRREINFGNCVISKDPINESHTVFTRKEFFKNMDITEDDYNVRNFQHIVTGKTKNINVLNHHGHHIPDHKNGNEETYRQMNQLAEYVTGLQGPVILCGDFNLSPDSESLSLINNHLDNLCIKNKLETTRTNLTNKKEVCDYIFVNSEVQVSNFFASEDVVSDHQALVLEFDA